MSDLQSAIRPTIEAYRRAIDDRNVEALIGLYDPAVRVFDAWDVWSYEGAAAWRKMIQMWFSSLGDEGIKVSFEEVQIVGDAQGLAAVSAIVTYMSLSVDGTELRSMPNRLTWVLKADAGGWKIVHEHTSALVGFHDKKAIFKRETAP